MPQGGVITRKFQCNRCGACVFSRKAADKHWNETCPKLKVKVQEKAGGNV